MDNITPETLTSGGGILAILVGILLLFFKVKVNAKDKVIRDTVISEKEKQFQKEVEEIEKKKEEITVEVQASELKSDIIEKQVDIKIDKTEKELQDDIKREKIEEIATSIKKKWDNI